MTEEQHTRKTSPHSHRVYGCLYPTTYQVWCEAPASFPDKGSLISLLGSSAFLTAPSLHTPCSCLTAVFVQRPITCHKSLVAWSENNTAWNRNEEHMVAIQYYLPTCLESTSSLIQQQPLYQGQTKTQWPHLLEEREGLTFKMKMFSLIHVVFLSGLSLELRHSSEFTSRASNLWHFSSTINADDFSIPLSFLIPFSSFKNPYELTVSVFDGCDCWQNSKKINNVITHFSKNGAVSEA